ncbi:DUF4062 domain-containing protein [Amnibacterium setariae]|uniref:DUF4062 domain-containing protein n=1 Tax=Amnibacterium setariae TaxID=2306585 RepID=UPI001314E165|nr:DUF4062 domain-containing protein [Amnibacterium setariae]
MSSTYLDLREERQAVISTLLDSDAFPAGMELFPATDDDAWTLIQQVIDDSDYYILVMGGKYGSLDPVSDLSFTEKEYDYAVATKKPVMAFLHGAPALLTVEKSEKKEDMQERLARFRAKVERSKHVKFWTGAEQLQGQVAVSFNRFTRQAPGIGWLRADAAASKETLAELAKARERIAELEAVLSAARSSPPAGIEDLAQGEDKVTVPVSARGSVRQTDRTLRNVGKWLRISTTWDQIFGYLGPTLLIEAEAEAMKETLNTSFLVDNFPAIETTVLERAREAKLKLPEDPTTSGISVELSNDDFGTVLIQLKATGLIEESRRKRSVADNGTYWTLTQFGEQRAVQIRALRRNADRETDLGIGDDEEPPENN